jgi:hypothetical protein
MKTIVNYVTDSLEYPVVKGSFLGAGVMAAATPGINYVVSKATKLPMPWSKPFTGCYALAGAGAVVCATSFAIKALLVGHEKKPSEWTRFWTTSVAGVASGIVLCPFESVAQTQLTTKASLINTAKTMYQYHGGAGFFRGVGSMMVREGAWISTCFAVAPILSQRMKDAGYNDVTSGVTSSVVSAGFFGVASAPINRARIMMQDKLAEPNTPHPRYRQLIKTMFQPSFRT